MVGAPAFSSAAVADDAVESSAASRVVEDATSGAAGGSGEDTAVVESSEEDAASSAAEDLPVVERAQSESGDAATAAPAESEPQYDSVPDAEQTEQLSATTLVEEDGSGLASATRAEQSATPSCRAGERLREAESSNRNGAKNTPYWYCEPEKTVVGQDIVIRGVGGYFALDGKTPSVIAFKVGPESSGDRDTLYTNRSVTNPNGGKDVGGGEIHAVVQAKADGTWEARIPFPTDGNSEWMDNSRTDKVSDAWKPGTQHVVTMLTDQMLSGDTRRSASAVINVVASDSDTVVTKKPSYAHYTYAPSAAEHQAGDRATAWLQSSVPAGASARFTGTGWLTADGMSGSRVEIRLVNESGKFYTRAGSAVIDDDPTLWQVLYPGSFGIIDSSIDLPKSVKAGSYVAVQLRTSSKLQAGDRNRAWTSAPITVAGQPWAPPPSAGAKCTAAPVKASYKLAPGMKTPAANVGGSIRLTGKNWCNLSGGGSLIAVKIDGGNYSHKGAASAQLYREKLGKAAGKVVGSCQAGICKTNKTIWFVIEADATGAFDVRVPLPTRTNTTPGFAEGQYTLQLLTRTVAADPYYKNARLDPSRTVQTAPFTVVAENKKLTNVKPGKPRAAADVLHATNDLRKGRTGGVRVTQRAKSWVVSVPKAAPGDWVYINVFDGATARFPWGGEWFRVSADRTVRLPLAGTTLPTGTVKVSAQDSVGKLLGWTRTTVAESRRAATGSGTSNSSGSATSGLQARAPSNTFSSDPPSQKPSAPVASYADLTRGNAGDVQAKLSGDTLRVTVPAADPGSWTYLYLYTEPVAGASEGRKIPIDWVQFGSDRSFTVELSGLPAGANRIALVGSGAKTGKLIGWVAAPGEPLSAAAAAESELDDAGLRAAGVVPVGGAADDATSTLVMLGIAVLVLAGSAAAVIGLRPHQTSPRTSTRKLPK